MKAWLSRDSFKILHHLPLFITVVSTWIVSRILDTRLVKYKFQEENQNVLSQIFATSSPHYNKADPCVLVLMHLKNDLCADTLISFHKCIVFTLKKYKSTRHSNHSDLFKRIHDFLKSALLILLRLKVFWKLMPQLNQKTLSTGKPGLNCLYHLEY